MTRDDEPVKEATAHVPAGDADKAEWRRWARARRRDVAGGWRASAVHRIVTDWLAGCAPTTVLLYRAMGDEITLDELATAPGLRAHRWATTRTPGSGPLSVHPWDSRLERHRFGFWQPTADAPLLALADIGVVLVPGLAFDRHGGRVGYGKGYYDTLLRGAAPGTRLVGVTYDDLVVERLPTTARDVPMTHLATESGLRPVPSPAR